MSPVETTSHSILRGKLTLNQPKEGYRAGIDPIFLAASIPLKSGESALEVGTGIGTALLCLAKRVEETRCTGLEMQRELVRIAAKNIKNNHMQDRVEVMTGDLLMPPPRLAASSFCHVFANPPYFEQARATKSENILKAHSNVESSALLEQWVEFCAKMVKPKGSVSFIFTSDRLADLISKMSMRLGSLEIFPLWSKGGLPAKRIIVRGWKNKNGPSKLHPGLLLHNKDGSYTREAAGILEDGLALDGWA